MVLATLLGVIGLAVPWHMTRQDKRSSGELRTMQTAVPVNAAAVWKPGQSGKFPGKPPSSSNTNP
jgi:hypothetical protein